MMLCSNEFAVHACPLLCLQRKVTKLASWLFYCWSLLRNNNMTTNLQVLTSSLGSKRFAAYDCWTWHICQGMQRDSDCR